jgi:hypothetical protein
VGATFIPEKKLDSFCAIWVITSGVIYGRVMCNFTNKNAKKHRKPFFPHVPVDVIFK